MIEYFPIVLASLSLVVSLSTLWLTFLRRGTVKMTLPTVVFFGPDGGESPHFPKVFFRALLYATSKRGCVIESMSVRLRRSESSQVFNIWTYGERNHLVRGSGLFVPQEGVAFNHHYLHPSDGTDYKFLAGTYDVEVFATLVGRSRPLVLRRLTLEISEAVAAQLKGGEAGVYFDWGAESQKYHSHVETRREEPPSPPFLPLLVGSDVRRTLAKESRTSASRPIVPESSKGEEHP